MKQRIAVTQKYLYKTLVLSAGKYVHALKVKKRPFSQLVFKLLMRKILISNLGVAVFLHGSTKGQGRCVLSQGPLRRLY